MPQLTQTPATSDSASAKSEDSLAQSPQEQQNGVAASWKLRIPWRESDFADSPFSILLSLAAYYSEHTPDKGQPVIPATRFSVPQGPEMMGRLLYLKD